MAQYHSLSKELQERILEDREKHKKNPYAERPPRGSVFPPIHILHNAAVPELCVPAPDRRVDP